MTVQEWLQPAVTQLNGAGITTARLDALVLLADVTARDRGYILAHPELELSALQVCQLKKLLKQRATHMPLAYVRGHAEFYGREFIVGPAVLVPRPETETMIDLLKKLTTSSDYKSLVPLDGQTWRLADVGAGSGALGITAALELPMAEVTLLEIDEAALAIAKVNVINSSTTTPVVQSNLLSNAHHAFDILLCNLPYVPDDYTINAAARHEPKIAIFGGSDGLDLYRKLFDQIKIVANKPLYILTEALPASHAALNNIAGKTGYQLLRTTDFIQIFTLIAPSN